MKRTRQTVVGLIWATFISALALLAGRACADLASDLTMPDSTPPATPAAADGTPPAAAPVPGAEQPAAKADSGAQEPASKDSSPVYQGGFFRRFWQANVEEFKPQDESAGDETPPARRALPAPFASPPFPSGEYQGYPLIGVPVEGSDYPLQKAINSGPCGDTFKDLRINIDGWVNASANWSNAEHSNAPTSYWFDPNSVQLNQFVLRAQRSCDTVQTDHVDWGFRSVLLYGQDYRYMVAGGWQPASDELLLHNDQYGLDLTEQYVEVYVPGITQGMVVRVGRWIACPDIETQYAPDNYMATHSILFTYDTYTQTGAMFSFLLNQQWMVQGAITAGTDMAPWYEGATPTGMFGVRWVSEDNKDSFYTCLNNINSAEFRHFDLEEGPAGHDNFNYIVTTWQHTFTPEIHMKTEGYYMWQVDAELGGTPSLGPIDSFGFGGGNGTLLPGLSTAYGVVNYLEFAISKKDFISVRNEWWDDPRGMRSGYPGVYSSHAIGLTHNFNKVLQIRPEVGFYRNWDEPAFDLGTKQNLVLAGFDVTYHF